MAVINDLDQKQSLIEKSLFGLKPQVTVHYRKGSHSAESDPLHSHKQEQKREYTHAAQWSASCSGSSLHS